MEIVIFPRLQEISSVKLFLKLLAFFFRMQKALVKNEIGVSGLIFSNLRHKLNVRSGKSF